MTEQEEHPSGLQILGSCPECAGPVWASQEEKQPPRCLGCNKEFPLDKRDAAA